MDNELSQDMDSTVVGSHSAGCTTLPVVSLSGGTFMIGDGIRIDPAPNNEMSILSFRSSTSYDPVEKFSIPQRFRPRLPAFLSLLTAAKKETASTCRGINSFINSFILTPVETRVQGNDLPYASSEIPKEEFFVGCCTLLPARKAANALLDTAALNDQEWLSPARTYQLITRKDRGWVDKKMLAARIMNQSTGESPVVASERFKVTAGNIYKGLLKSGCNAILIKGDAGSGKSCLVNYISQEFKHMRAPARLQGHLVVSINIELFLPSSSTSEEYAKSQMRKQMAGRRIIWVIDEATRLIEHGNTDALDTLLLFIDHGAKCILLSDQSYLLEKREAFVRRLISVNLLPAADEEVAEVAWAFSQYLSDTSGLMICPEAVQAAVDLSCSIPYAQPHAVSDLLARTFSGCEVRGENEVHEESVRRELREFYSLEEIPVGTQALIKRIRSKGFRGHHSFLNKLCPALIRAMRCRFNTDRRPGAAWVCLITGNHGIGKSMLLEIVAEIICGSKRRILTIDCSSYKEKHSLQTLRGSPKSYIGYDEGGSVQNFVKKNPNGALIFELPEHGHPDLYDLIAEISDGSFTAGDGQIVSTRHNIVMISTSVGSEGLIHTIGFGTDCKPEDSTGISHALNKEFGPEMLSRIGTNNIFRMPPLEQAALRNILRLAIHNYGISQSVRIVLDVQALNQVVLSCNTALHGARSVLGQFYTEVVPLIDVALEKCVKQGTASQTLAIELNQANGKITCRPADGGTIAEVSSPDELEHEQ